MNEQQDMVVDLLEGEWSSLSPGCIVERREGCLVVQNDTDADAVVRFGEFLNMGRLWARLGFRGMVLAGDGVVLCSYSNVATTDGTSLNRAEINSDEVIFGYLPDSTITFELLLKARSCVQVTELAAVFLDGVGGKNRMLEDYADGRILIITPDYPAPSNKYLCAFVHSRVLAYRRAGLEPDVLVVSDTRSACRYGFEGSSVLAVGYDDAAYVLARHRYETIAIHFFDDNVAKIIEASDGGDARVILWCHTPEVRYWTLPEFARGYDNPAMELTAGQIASFTRQDALIRRLNEDPRVHWVFINDWERVRAQDEIGVEFGRYSVIPNFVDAGQFPYREKGADLQKKVFCVRRFDNAATYALDVLAQTIVELSRRPCFDELTFDIFGNGNYYDELTRDIRNFENVHLHRHFLTHDEITQQHAAHGIALFPTRTDSQGVSADEAALSGLAVVSSDIDAARYFLPGELGLLAPVDDAQVTADIVECLAMNGEYFQQCAKACHDKVALLCGYDHTIAREIELLTEPTGRDAQEGNDPICAGHRVKRPLLTFAIPALGSLSDLKDCVDGIYAARNADLVEVLLLGFESQKDVWQLVNNYHINGRRNVRFAPLPVGRPEFGIVDVLEQMQGRFVKMMMPYDVVSSDKMDYLIRQLLQTDNMTDAIYCGYTLMIGDKPIWHMVPYDACEAKEAIQEGDFALAPVISGVFRTQSLIDQCLAQMPYESDSMELQIIGAIGKITQVQTCPKALFAHSSFIPVYWDDADRVAAAQRSAHMLSHIIAWRESACMDGVGETMKNGIDGFIAALVNGLLRYCLRLPDGKVALEIIKPIWGRVMDMPALAERIWNPFGAVTRRLNRVNWESMRAARKAANAVAAAKERRR